MEGRKPLIVIAKVTDRCNLGCRYCYAASSQEEKDLPIMDSSTVENMLEKIGNYNQSLSNSCFNPLTRVIWHGGEPLEAGLDFYENVVWMQYWLRKNKGFRYQNSIQTNGVLVDEKIINFCKRHKFALGFSLDGSEEAHNQARPYKDGSDSFRDVLRGMRLASQAKIGGRGAIVVINKKTLPHIDEIYEFFKRENFSLRINPLIRAGRAMGNIDDLGITPREYSDAMIHLFDRYIDDEGYRGTIDPFDTIMGNVSTNENYGLCTFSPNCQDSFISVNARGEVYPCGRFDGVNVFRFGNINTDRFEEIVDHPVRRRLQQRGPKTVEACQECDYKEVCNSGCLNNAYMDRGNIMDSDYYCPAYRRIFKHIIERVDRELDLAEVR